MASKQVGGSRSLVVPRKRKKGVGRDEAARERAVIRFSEETVTKMRLDWDSWETGVGGKEWQQAEGMIMQLLQQNVSERVIRAILPVGGSRITRLRDVLRSGVETLDTRRVPTTPWHALSDANVGAFKDHCDSWELEDGFPCAHRRPRQYFLKAKLTWKTLHEWYGYEVTRVDLNARVISYTRFLQLVQFHYPGVRLTRTAEDVCDCCVRLDVQLSRDDLTPEEPEALLENKKMHLTAAIEQRCFVSSFIKAYIAQHAPDQTPPDIIPDVIETSPPTDDSSDAVLQHVCRIQIQAEDFGGGIAMPHYGHARPSADYFNSNLIIQNFVVADITNNLNNVYFYDERVQGKGADALCGLRLFYHLSTSQDYVCRGIAAPEVSFSLLDNCVGQNKSKVLLMFSALLSVVFPYKKVVLCFLLPKHSHNIADRVVAWCRRATRGLNLYTPEDLVNEVNKVKSVNGVFLDHRSTRRPFFTEWGTLLSKYFVPPSPSYTANYLFEIDAGVCTARKFVSTPDTEATIFSLVKAGVHEVMRKAIMADLFGSTVDNIHDATINDVILPRHQVKEMTTKKVKSLAAKFFSIPSEFLGYYPAVPEAVANCPAGEVASRVTGSKSVSSKNKPGRPARKTPQLIGKQPSILQFFTTVDSRVQSTYN